MTIRVNDNVVTIRLESLSGQVTAHADAGDIDLGSVPGPAGVTSHAGSILGQNVSSAAHAPGGRVALVRSARRSASVFTIRSVRRRMSALNGPMSNQ
jgi:hypothetical protein